MNLSSEASLGKIINHDKIRGVSVSSDVIGHDWASTIVVLSPFPGMCPSPNKQTSRVFLPHP